MKLDTIVLKTSIITLIITIYFALNPQHMTNTIAQMIGMTTGACFAIAIIILMVRRGG